MVEYFLKLLPRYENKAVVLKRHGCNTRLHLGVRYLMRTSLYMPMALIFLVRMRLCRLVLVVDYVNVSIVNSVLFHRFYIP